MELSHLRYFVAVAEADSMSRAAARLGVSQPTISRQIRNLERELGCRLLHRHDRGVELTDAGRTLHKGVARILVDLDRLRDSVRRSTAQPAPVLRIGLVQIAQWFPLIPRSLDNFRRRYPDVAVEGLQILSRRQPEALLSGEVDIAIGAPMLGLPDGIQSMKLFDLARGLVMSRKHALANRDALTIADIAPFPLTGYSRTTWPASNDVLIEEARRHGFELRFTETFDSATMLLARVGLNDSLALLPEPGPLAPMEDLVFKRIADFDASIPIRVCWLPDAGNPHVDLFVEELRDQILILA